jgi:hypothetical protein
LVQQPDDPPETTTVDIGTTAITEYHDLLSSETLAADSQSQLERLQESRGLFFGKRPVCSVLRPRFITTSQYQLLKHRTSLLLPAFQTAYDRAMADTTFRKQFRLLDWEEQLLEIEPRFKQPSPTSRFDSFFVSENELKFTEFNTETPAGAGYTDSLADVFYGMPVFQEFIPAVPGAQQHTAKYCDPRLARSAHVQRIRALLRLLPQPWAGGA